MPDHLADEFLGASIRGAGAAWGTEERRSAFLQEEGAELEVALTAKTELGGGTVNAALSVLSTLAYAQPALELCGQCSP